MPDVQTLSEISGVVLPSLVQHQGVGCLLPCVLLTCSSLSQGAADSSDPSALAPLEAPPD